MRYLFGLTMLLVAMSSVKAAPYTYDLTGIITQTGTMPLVPVVVGQSIPIVITVNDAYPQDPPGSGSYHFLGGDPITGFIAPIMSATFDGEELANFIQMVSVSPSRLSIFTTGPQTGTGFQLDFGGGFNSVGGAFPVSIDQATIVGGTFSVHEAFSVDTYGYSGVITGTQLVPEPSSAPLLGISLIAAAILLLRRELLC